VKFDGLVMRWPFTIPNIPSHSAHVQASAIVSPPGDLACPPGIPLPCRASDRPPSRASDRPPSRAMSTTLLGDSSQGSGQTPRIHPKGRDKPRGFIPRVGTNPADSSQGSGQTPRIHPKGRDKPRGFIPRVGTSRPRGGRFRPPAGRCRPRGGRFRPPAGRWRTTWRDASGH